MQFSAAADGRQLTIDNDCAIIGFLGAGAAASTGMLSKDPKSTIANSVTTPTDQLNENILAISRASIFAGPIFIPFSAGQSVFVSVSAAMNCFIYFQLIA